MSGDGCAIPRRPAEIGTASVQAAVTAETYTVTTIIALLPGRENR